LSFSFTAQRLCFVRLNFLGVRFLARFIKFQCWILMLRGRERPFLGGGGEQVFQFPVRKQKLVLLKRVPGNVGFRETLFSPL